MPKPFENHLFEAKKHQRIADHMTYVTYPILNEKRLLIKIFEEVCKSITFGIKSIISFENNIKNNVIINEYDRFLFHAKNYNLNNRQISIIKEIIELENYHKNSSMEFMKKEKIVILSDNLSYQTLDISQIKRYLLLSRQFLEKISQKQKF